MGTGNNSDLEHKEKSYDAELLQNSQWRSAGHVVD